MTKAQNKSLHVHLRQIQQRLDAAFRLAECGEVDDTAENSKMQDEQTLQAAATASGPTDLLDLAHEGIRAIIPHALASAAIMYETKRNFLWHAYKTDCLPRAIH